MRRLAVPAAVVAAVVFAQACSGGKDSCNSACRDASEEAAAAIHQMAEPLKTLVSSYANVTTSLAIDLTDDCRTLTGNLVITSNVSSGFPDLSSGDAQSTWACPTITGGPLEMNGIVDGSVGGWDYDVAATEAFLVDGFGCEVDIRVVEIDDYPSDLDGEWCGTPVAPLPGDG